MSQFIKLLAEGVNVAPLYWAMLNHPELWNVHTHRTEHPDSPHHGLDDMWLRFGSPERIQDNLPHEAEWYPAADILGVKPLLLGILQHVGGTALGGVLVTRIPAGKTCRPHQDLGWHALHYEKFGLQIAAAPGQAFCFHDGELATKPGDLFWFNNQQEHWVVNPTDYERVTLIACIRKED